MVNTGSTSPAACAFCRGSRVSAEPLFFQTYPQEGGSLLRNGYYCCQDCEALFVYPMYTADQVVSHWKFVDYANPKRNSEYQLLKSHVEITLLDKIGKLSKGKRLLDYGCGFGNFMARAKGRGFEITGLEPNPDAATLLKEKGFRTRQAWTMKEASFPDECFDVVVALDSFCYTWDPRETLEEFHRALSPSGILAMRISNKHLFIDTVLKVMRPGEKRDALLEKGIMKQFHSVSISSLKKILSDVGFSVVEVLGAATAPFRMMGWPGRISYAIAATAHLLTFGKVVIHPGVLLLARKTKKGCER